jgi:hypothetical protein
MIDTSAYMSACQGSLGKFSALQASKQPSMQQHSCVCHALTFKVSSVCAPVPQDAQKYSPVQCKAVLRHGGPNHTAATEPCQVAMCLAAHAMSCHVMSCRAALCCAGVKAQGIWFSTTYPGRVLVGLNKRQKSVFDVYCIELKSGKVTLDTVNPGNVTSWVVTPRLQVGVSTRPPSKCWLVLLGLLDLLPLLVVLKQQASGVHKPMGNYCC